MMSPAIFLADVQFDSLPTLFLIGTVMEATVTLTVGPVTVGPHA